MTDADTILQLQRLGLHELGDTLASLEARLSRLERRLDALAPIVIGQGVIKRAVSYPQASGGDGYINLVYDYDREEPEP